MCTALMPPAVNPIAVNKYIISYHIISNLIYVAIEAWNQEMNEKFEWTHQRNAHMYTGRHIENMAVFQVYTKEHPSTK